MKTTLLLASLLMLSACGENHSGSEGNSSLPMPETSTNKDEVSAGITDARVIRKDAKYFKVAGEFSKFEWAPVSYKSDFRYDVSYYIPLKIKDAKNAKSLVFMHGGGDETLTRINSYKMSIRYKKELIKIAETLGMIIVLPSAAGLNWGGHTPYMIRSLVTLMQKELDLDNNNIGLSGHSMGGMGITRSFPLLTDVFAYMVPNSSGMDVKLQYEDNLNKLFNVPYVQLQGKKDSFEVFIARGLRQAKNMSILQLKYRTKAPFEFVLYEGDHQMDVPLWISTIERLQKSPRNLYQKDLWGVFFIDDRYYIENDIRFFHGSQDRYFWIKAIEADASKSEVINFRAKIEKNKILINLNERPKQIRKLRVFLSHKMVNLKKKVKIYINGELTARHKYKEKKKHIEKIISDTDPSYAFDDYVDINLEKFYHEADKKDEWEKENQRQREEEKKEEEERAQYIEF